MIIHNGSLLLVILPVTQLKFNKTFIMYGVHLRNERKCVKMSAHIGYTRSKKKNLEFVFT